jgi:ABC-type bacteriocin/lantibiotic exporter with double-glycine peptidase domain
VGGALVHLERHHVSSVAVSRAPLQEIVGMGRPLIVALHLGGSRYHDVVVVGFDNRRGAVLVHDPAAGPSRAVSVAKFEKRWAGAGYWTLLVTRKEH